MLVGTSLALLALAFVLYPLFQEPLGMQTVARPAVGGRGVSAVEALREIEFDHATGKLSDRDYSELRASYTDRALTTMRAATAGSRACDVCGPRPQADARFCSDCGREIAA